MAQKMTLSAYLVQRGKKAKALTKAEAALLGIPFPLQAGWPRRYGGTVIEQEMLEQLADCAEVARQAANEKAKRTRVKKTIVSPTLHRHPGIEGGQAGERVVAGFVLRRARRYRVRYPAAWARTSQ